MVEGMHCYASMVMVYMISPKLERYTCMVNVLGHAGHLQEAENMLKMMPDKSSMPGTCSNVEMGACVAKQVLELEPENAMGYVLLSNICASAGNRHLSENIEQQRKERGQFAFALE